MVHILLHYTSLQFILLYYKAKLKLSQGNESKQVVLYFSGKVVHSSRKCLIYIQSVSQVVSDGFSQISWASISPKQPDSISATGECRLRRQTCGVGLLACREIFSIYSHLAMFGKIKLFNFVEKMEIYLFPFEIKVKERKHKVIFKDNDGYLWY